MTSFKIGTLMVRRPIILVQHIGLKMPQIGPKWVQNWPNLAKFKNNHVSFFFPALKVKLMVRRPMTTLVEQGILPSPKTSPALYEQKQKLERAKKGDLLKSMIAKRPDRQELVHR